MQGAQWIGGNQLLRKDFSIDPTKPYATPLQTGPQLIMSSNALRLKSSSVERRVAQAFAYVVGLGYYKLEVDGHRVSTHELGPFTTFTRRVCADNSWGIGACDTMHTPTKLLSEGVDVTRRCTTTR